MIRKVILVFKTHVDIGFTNLAEEVMKGYTGSILERVLATCRATEDWGTLHYVWTLPAWPLMYILKHCREKQKKELEHFIEKGQITWHALAFTSHTDFCGEEEYLESFRYAKKLSEWYGKPYPRTAKMTDVPGHGLMLPEVLAAGGVRFLHLGCNDFATPPEVPGLFWWEAASGRRVLTMYHRGGYGSGIAAPEGWSFPVWMALMPTMDNFGPDQPERIIELKEQVRNRYPDAEVICGTMDDFWEELERCNLSGLPAVRRDLADTWIHGVGAYPAEISEIREMRRKFRALNLRTAMEDPRLLSKIETESYLWYENMHLFGEHTWGADVKTFLDPAERVYDRRRFDHARMTDLHYAFMEKSWNEQRERARKAEKALSEMRKKLKTKSIEDNVNRQVMTESLKIHREGCLISVSGGAWKLTVDTGRGVIKRLSSAIDDTVVLEERRGKPVFGYLYYRYGTQRMTEFLRKYAYHFSTWGIRDNGRSGYPECKTQCFAVKYSEWETDGRDLILTGSFRESESFHEYGNAETVRLRIHFPEEITEGLSVTLHLLNKQPTPYIEAGSFLIPMRENQKEFRINKNGILINPAVDIAENSNHCFYALENFACAFPAKSVRTETDRRKRAEDQAVAVISPDSLLLSIGEDETYNFRKRYEQQDPVFCFNLFNNMWGTNFPQWIEGNLTYRFVIKNFKPSEEEKIFPYACETADKICGIADAAINDAVRSGRLPDCGADMQLLGIHPQGKGYRISVRNLTEHSGRQLARWSGYCLSETDYFGRPVKVSAEKGGEGLICQEHDRGTMFEKKPYSLHVFYAEAINAQGNVF